MAQWLQESGEDIVGLILQPPDDRRFADEILSALDLPANKVWTADQLRDADTLAELRELSPDIGISAFFGFILKPEVIQLFPRGCINLHAALLPYNRGWHTNVWPIIDGSPAGATIHYIDPGVDTGDIIAQHRIPVEPTDTGGSLHEKIIRRQVDLFKEIWPLLRKGKTSRTPQDHSKATGHRKAELGEISRIHLDRIYRAGDLIDLLRARTYPPYPSAYYVEGEQRTYVRIELLRESQLAALGMPESVRQTLPRGDLDAQYRASDLLSLLGTHDSSPNHFLHFTHESGPLFARGHVADEREFKTGASPEWTTQSAMKIAAGVLHYRHWPGVRPTLDTLREQTRPPEHVVVIDHASGDGSAQHIREAYPEVEVVEITSNRGPIAGMNHVLRETLAQPVDAVFILPDDASLAPNVLQLLAERLQERPSLGAVCALNAYPGDRGQTMIHYGGYIDRRTWHLKFSAEPGDVADWTDRPPHPVDWIEAAAMLFRATAAHQAGPLNESFYHRDGEAEFTIRMHSLGWELECVPAAVVHTDFGEDSIYLNTRNHLEIIRLHAPTRFLARELVRVCYLVARDVLSLRRRPTADTWNRLRGLIDFVRRHWGPPPGKSGLRAA